MLHTQNAGPGLLKREWHRLNEFEVGRPKLRARKNPVPATSGTGTNPDGSPSIFPFPGTAFANATLQLLAWNLRDTFLALPNKAWNVISQLFTTGQNGPLTPIGGTTSFNKPILLANIQSNNGLLPSPQSFLVSHLRQIINAQIQLLDLMNLLYSTYYQFVAGDQNWVYFEGPGATLPSGATQPNVGVVGSTYAATASSAGVGWSVTHNVASLKSGLFDPTIGGEDMGYNIAQNKQFRFNLDPTQFSFPAGVATFGSWTTVNSQGAGVQVSIELCGVLARGMNG